MDPGPPEMGVISCEPGSLRPHDERGRGGGCITGRGHPRGPRAAAAARHSVSPGQCDSSGYGREQQDHGPAGQPPGVNKNTVLRALHLLREEGLLEFRRGRGITVVGTPQRGAVLARARELVEFARRHGFGRDEVIQMIETLP